MSDGQRHGRTSVAAMMGRRATASEATLILSGLAGDARLRHPLPPAAPEPRISIHG